MEPGNKKKAWWEPALAVFAKMSAWIGAPVLIGLFLGKWLDKKYDTEPWLLLVSVGIAFTVSMAGLVLEASKEFKRIEKENKKNKDQQK